MNTPSKSLGAPASLSARSLAVLAGMPALPGSRPVSSSVRIKELSKSLLPGLGKLASSILLVSAVSTHAVDRQVLAGHIPPALARLQPIDRLASTNRLKLTIGLPLRNRPALTNLLQQLYDPASAQYHRYLTPDQFTKRFGPTEKEYQAAFAFAES